MPRQALRHAVSAARRSDRRQSRCPPSPSADPPACGARRRPIPECRRTRRSNATTRCTAALLQQISPCSASHGGVLAEDIAPDSPGLRSERLSPKPLPTNGAFLLRRQQPAHLCHAQQRRRFAPRIAHSAPLFQYLRKAKRGIERFVPPTIEQRHDEEQRRLVPAIGFTQRAIKRPALARQMVYGSHRRPATTLPGPAPAARRPAPWPLRSRPAPGRNG